MTGKEKLCVTIIELDLAIKILKKDRDYWHTPRELDDIDKSIKEIEKFKSQLIKKVDNLH